MQTRVVLFRLFPALILAACAPKAEQQAGAPPAVDSAAVRAAVADLWARYTTADSAGDVAAIMDFVTDSVRFDMRGMPAIVGKPAWQAAATGMYQMYKYEAIRMNPERTIAMTNDLAYERGSYHQAMTEVKTRKKTTDYGRYATAIRKDADGKWRMVYMMAFVDSTVAAK